MYFTFTKMIVTLKLLGIINHDVTHVNYLLFEAGSLCKGESNGVKIFYLTAITTKKKKKKKRKEKHWIFPRVTNEIPINIKTLAPILSPKDPSEMLVPSYQVT